MPKKAPAYARPVCKECRKHTAYRGREVCSTCAAKRPPEPKPCLVCGCRKATNWENCRACDLTVSIAILRARAAREWLQLKHAIKELIYGK